MLFPSAGGHVPLTLGKGGGEFTVLRKPFLLAELSRAAARMIADMGEPAGGNVVRLRDVRRSG
jgi:hypothetical protein